MNKSALRTAFRKKRRSLSAAQQKKASYNLLLHLASHPLFLRAQRIAFYFSNDGEISPEALSELALRKHKQCFSPALTDDGNMLFRRYTGHDSLERHAFGFLQPPKEQPDIDAKKLDLVLVPLVAFNMNGDRIGMGGGFYDRAFAFKHKHPKLGPALFGLAHDCQRAIHIKAQPWDVRLNAIYTNKKIIIPK